MKAFGQSLSGVVLIDVDREQNLADALSHHCSKVWEDDAPLPR